MRTRRMKNVWSSPAWRAVYPNGFSEIMKLNHIWILCAVIFLHLCIFVFLWSVSSFFFVLYAVYDSWILMPPCNCCQEVIIALLYLITFDKIPIISLSFTCFRVNIQWKWKMLDIEQWTMNKEEYSIFMVIASKTSDNNKVVLFNVFIETTIQSTTKCFHSLTKPVSTSGQGFVKNSFWISH